MAKGKTNSKKKEVASDTVEITVKGKTLAVPTDEAMRNEGMVSLSSRIRHLAGMGLSVSQTRDIVKRENGQTPLYQHVRNVLITPLKKDQKDQQSKGA